METFIICLVGVLVFIGIGLAIDNDLLHNPF